MYSTLAILSTMCNILTRHIGCFAMSPNAVREPHAMRDSLKKHHVIKHHAKGTQSFIASEVFK